MVKNNKGYGNK